MLHYSLRELEVFCAIAQQGTVRAAADRVALSQPAASHALARLERALQRRLFDRTGRKLVLNEAGRQLLPRARSLLDDAAAIQQSGAGAVPALRLAASTTIANYLLPVQLAAYRDRYPAAPVQVQVGNTAEVVASVAAMRVDFGLIEGPCQRSELQVRFWRDDPMVLIAPPAHPAARDRCTREALAGMTWLLREPGSGTRAEVERWLLSHLGTVRADIELGNSEAIKRGVAAGLGVSCLPRVMVSDLIERGLVVEIRSELPMFSRVLSIIHHGQRGSIPGMKAFLALQ